MAKKTIAESISQACEKAHLAEFTVPCHSCGCGIGMSHAPSCRIRALNIERHACRPDLFDAQGNPIRQPRTVVITPDGDWRDVIANSQIGDTIMIQANIPLHPDFQASPFVVMESGE